LPDIHKHADIHTRHVPMLISNSRNQSNLHDHTAERHITSCDAPLAFRRNYLGDVWGKYTKVCSGKYFPGRICLGGLGEMSVVGNVSRNERGGSLVNTHRDSFDQLYY